MLNENDRCCDVCGSAPTKDAKYHVIVVPEKKALLFKSIVRSERDPDLVPTYSVDLSGNIRLDICAECYLGLWQQGTEHVN